MLNDPQSPAPGLLYIDDEAQALKYFRMAFSQKFETFTAGSGEEGLEVLAREGDRIAIVISDQRMPGMLGAEFLGHVRERHPNALRILTTAYSDLDSAIQAVNRGFIYQYVVKPWDVDELSIILLRAADYHRILTERNRLLRLKMTTLQRILCTDRLKWLLIHSRTLSERKQAAFRRALVSFIKAMPATPDLAAVGEGFQRNRFEVGKLVLDEYANASRCLDLMNSWDGAGEGQPLPAHLAEPLEALAARENGEVWSVSDSLRRFLSTLIDSGRLAPAELALTAGDAFAVRLAMSPGESSFDTNGLVREWFALLVGRETPEVSVRFFETLLALSLAGGTLGITVTPAGAPAPTFTLDFAPAAEPDQIEAIVDELYQNFSEADLSAL
jgi:ActR/RegA family two-component response regulator